MIKDPVQRYDNYEVGCPNCNNGIVEMDVYDLENHLIDKRMDGASFKELITIYRFWRKTGGRLCPECDGCYIKLEEVCR